MSKIHLNPKQFRFATDCVNYNWTDNYQSADNSIQYNISTFEQPVTVTKVASSIGYVKWHIVGTWSGKGAYPNTWTMSFYNEDLNQHNTKTTIRIINNGEVKLQYLSGSYFRSKGGEYSHVNLNADYSLFYQIPDGTYLGQTNCNFVDTVEGGTIDSYVEIEVCKGVRNLITTSLNIKNQNTTYEDWYTREQLLLLIKDLQKLQGKTLTLTLGSVLLAKLTDEDKKIATDKGWTLA